MSLTKVTYSMIDNTGTCVADRFEGVAVDDAGTPDAVFRVNRTHTASTSPHAFRDQTLFSPAVNNFAAASFDAQMVSSGAANLNHTIGFQTRNAHYGPGTLQTYYGFGSYPVIAAPVTDCIGLDIVSPSGGGAITNEYGVYIHNQNSPATNKYPIYVANNLGQNSIGAATNFNGGGVVSVGTNVKIFIGDSANGYKSVAYNHNQNTNTYDAADAIQSIYYGAQDIVFRAAPVGVAGATPSFTNIFQVRTDLTSGLFGAVFPSVDNVSYLGISGLRWKEIYCANGTINTSDARVKTEVRALTDREIDAAKDLAKEIGAFKFLKSVEEKGDAAREHIGMTVQRAIQIMQSHGLDPMNYGFICHDTWEDEYEDHPAVYHKTVDADGNVVNGEIKDAAWREHKVKAGDLYSFRSDQLLLFIARGFEARLAALESASTNSPRA